MILRDYQIDIANQANEVLKNHGIVYLAMQVRTGKTATALQTAKLYGAKRVLFVTKKKAISSIVDDADALKVSFELVVINYEQLPKMVIDYETFENEFDFFICDEAHGMGSFPKPSERARNMLKLVQSKPLILLSGSPTPESFSQLYHQFWISANSPWHRYGTFYNWAKVYVRVFQKKFAHGLVNDYSRANKEMIDADTKNLFISYTQEEAGFTEAVQEEIIIVKMQPVTYTIIEKLIRDRIVKNNQGEVILGDTAVKLMQKIHQLSSGTCIIDNEERKAKVIDYSKVNYIKEHFAGKKIAIFYKFIAEGLMLQYTFPGLTTSDPDEFNSSSNKIFISQIQSGREGVNLSTADCLIMLNIDFSHVSYIQSRARLQTKDRDKAAKVFWLFSDAGIEQKIYDVVQKKKDYQLKYFNRDYGIRESNSVPNSERTALAGVAGQ